MNTDVDLFLFRILQDFGRFGWKRGQSRESDDVDLKGFPRHFADFLIVRPAMMEWEEADRMSFDDSDRFEEDSLCSWGSEPESLCNNWRGWKKPLVPSTAIGPPILASNQRRTEGEF